MQLRESEHKAQSLQSEKAQLTQEMKAMQRDVSKLDQFKRSIMQSIQDDEPEQSRFRLAAAPSYDPVPAPRAYAPSPPQASASPPVPVASVPRYTGSASAASSPPAAYPLSAPGSVPPPDGGSAHLDGKDFFRQARLRLTYEQFNQFLSNIKRLNDHAQTREDTLLRAQEIFGTDNQDLFVAFKNLLTKHGLT